MPDYLNTQHSTPDGGAFRMEMKTLSCIASYGTGGLGRHFEQLVEDARDAQCLNRYYASAIRPGDAAGQVVEEAWFPRLAQYTPVRFSPGWQSYLSGELFDRAVAARLSGVNNTGQNAQGATFIGVAGQAYHSFQQARKTGYERVALAAPTNHVNRVARQHALSRRVHGMEATWMNEAYIRKCRAEYAQADVILANSELTRQTFLDAGVPEAKLQRVWYKTSPRFQPPATRPEDGVFRVAYVGSLTINKGIPLLVEAFSRLAVKRAELTLVGGWATRGMRAYLQEWMARDARIRVAPGDPLPVLQRADVCVHASYEDGWAYAPMEALACGVPVIVSEDTGMKECVRDGVNGYVVPTGDWQAILERLEQMRSHPLPLPVTPAFSLSAFPSPDAP